MNEPAALPSYRWHAVPCGVAGVMLLVGIGEHPIGYYTLLRWVVCFAAALAAWIASDYARERPEQQWAWTAVVGYATIAVLFNPLWPIYLERGQWLPIDVAAAVALFASAGLPTRMKAW